MRAIDRTTERFVASVRAAIPDVRLRVCRSVLPHGRSNYVYIEQPGNWRTWSVRISDHPVGMRRALSGQHQLFIPHIAAPGSWSIWLGSIARQHQEMTLRQVGLPAQAPMNPNCFGPLFIGQWPHA